jgi:hypothetical protein
MFVCLLMPGLAAVFTRTQNRIALAELELNKMRDNLYEIEGSKSTKMSQPSSSAITIVPGILTAAGLGLLIRYRRQAARPPLPIKPLPTAAATPSWTPPHTPDGQHREIPYLSEALHTIEQFTIVDENNIDYLVTIDDP